MNLGDISNGMFNNGMPSNEGFNPLRKVIKGKIIKPQDENCFLGQVQETKQDPVTGEIITYDIEVTANLLGTGELVNNHRDIKGKCKTCGSYGTKASIGRCTQCGDTFCIKHIGLYSGHLVCNGCYKKLDTFWNSILGHKTSKLRGRHELQQKLLGEPSYEQSRTNAGPEIPESVSNILNNRG